MRPGWQGIATLVYRSHQFEPEDMLGFIELKPFTRDWEGLKLTVEDLFVLQAAICAGPKVNPVIRGTGGLRKMRFAPHHWKTGKSGALRVCYAYFELYSIVLLVNVYPKSMKDDLSAEERKAIRKLLEHIEDSLSTQTYN